MLLQMFLRQNSPIQMNVECRVRSMTILWFCRINKMALSQEDFDKKRSRAAIKAQAMKEMEKEKEVGP